MSCSPSSRTIVCKEIFDENSVPSEEEVRDYAVKIGINPESEPHLLHFARDGLMQALPPGWKPCYDEELQSWYYFNFRSGESRWEHPLDDVYRNLVRKVRSESISSAGEEDSKTSAKEDLKSYEEAAPSTQDSMQPAPHTLGSVKGGSVLKKAHIQLAPLKKSPVLSPLATPSSASPKKIQASPLSSPAGSKSPTSGMESKFGKHSAASDAEPPRPMSTRIDLGGGGHKEPFIHKDILSPTSARIDIDKMDMGSLVKKSEENAISRKERLLSAQEKHPRGMTGRGELTLTGGGSMFLKSRQQKQESPTATASSPSPGAGLSPTSDMFGGVVEVISSKDDENLPKSILRDQQRPSSGGKPLWDVDPREMSNSETLRSNRGRREERINDKSRSANRKMGYGFKGTDRRDSRLREPCLNYRPRPLSPETAFTSEEKQLWRRQELEEERKSVRFNLEQELDIRFNLSDTSDHDEGEEEEEEGEDWNSDEEDPDEERVIAGIRVSDILNLMDASDLEEVSTGEDADKKVVKFSSSESRKQHSLESASRPSLGVSKLALRPGARSVNGTRFTVERVHEPEMDGTSLLISSSKLQSEGSSLSKQQHELGLEPYEKTDLQHTSSLVSNVTPSSEDMLEPILSPCHGKQEKHDSVGDVDCKDQGIRVVNEVDSSQDHNGCLPQNLDVKDEVLCDEVGDKDKCDVDSEKNEKLVEKAVEVDRQVYQERLAKEIQKLEEENEKALQRHKEILAQRLEESVKQLETDHQSSLEALRSQLAKQEAEDEVKLRSQFEEKMATIETDLKAQQENQEKSIRENMEAFLQDLRDTLETERKVQVQALQVQDEVRRQQVAEFKQNLENDRVRLEQETSEQIANLEKQLAEELETERARLEAAHAQHMQELAELNEKEIETTRTRLQEELVARKDELQQDHAKEMEKIDAELREIMDKERAAKLLELDEAKKRSESFEKLKREMEQELEQKRQELTADHEAIVIELKAENAVRIEKLKLDFRMEEEQVRREHIERLDELRSRLSRELELERQRLVKANEQQNDSTRQELAESSRVFEKLRCEKRLLEDKYRSLKEKYIRLKTDVKISMERRKRRDAGGTTTGSETERSTSHKNGGVSGSSGDAKGRQQVNDGAGSGSSNEKQRSNRRRTATAEALPSDSNSKAPIAELPAANNKAGPVNSPKNWQGSARNPPEGKRGEDGVDSDNISSSVSLPQHKAGKQPESADAHNTNNNRRRRQLFGRLKSASTSRLLLNNNNNSNTTSNNNNSSGGQGETGGNQGEDSSCSPVENLRRQLQKLEDLEDQFPASTHTDTYLRYPFTADSGQLGSSELEFFRHRIHLERDSVRRAKDFLRAQRSSFQTRQRELKQRQLDGSTTARNMLDQLYQEERELTDMEVSLHRTRSLLGEKIIRLRHLEQSLHRASSPRPKGHEKHEPREDATLSDLSSHSGSSGFSSTELGTDTQLGKVNPHRPVGGTATCSNGHYQESTEIIQSLENLNTEIREIWEVLNKQQKDGTARQVVPPPPLVYPDLGWPMMVSSRAAAAPVLRQPFAPGPQNAAAQFAPGLGWSMQGQNGAMQLTQLGAALAHPAGAAQFGGTVLGAANAPAVTDPSLVERTRSLRDWLRQARIDSADLISPGQATL